MTSGSLQPRFTRALTVKNVARIAPLETPLFYDRVFDAETRTFTLRYEQGGTPQVFTFQKRVDDPATSFAACVLRNERDKHTVIIYKGTDLPGRDEGSGHLGFLGDIKSILQARHQLANQQTPIAEKLYRETIANPDVETLEIIGFSAGTLHLNYVAAKYGACGTAIADMGISDHALVAIFNRNLTPRRKKYSPEQVSSEMQKRITVLDLSKDKLPEFFQAGPSRGRIISLDTETWKDWMGLAHIRQAYMVGADEKSVHLPAPSASI